MKKVVLITGANRGIGYGVEQKFSQNEEYVVIMTARNKEAGIQVMQSLPINEDCYCYELDIASMC